MLSALMLSAFFLSFESKRSFFVNKSMWRRGVLVITTAQLHSTKPELRFCECSNPARGLWEIRDGDDL